MENITFRNSISKCGIFIDYFGNPIKIGDKVIFKSNDFINDNDFYRARVKDLITQQGEYGLDYCLLDDVESPHLNGKVKNGSKIQCQFCIVVK